VLFETIEVIFVIWNHLNFISYTVLCSVYNCTIKYDFPLCFMSSVAFVIFVLRHWPRDDDCHSVTSRRKAPMTVECPPFGGHSTSRPFGSMIVAKHVAKQQEALRADLRPGSKRRWLFHTPPKGGVKHHDAKRRWWIQWSVPKVHDYCEVIRIPWDKHFQEVLFHILL
jgi:hypothetical protein